MTKIISAMADENGVLWVMPTPIFMLIYGSTFIGWSSSSSLSMGPVTSMTLSSSGEVTSVCYKQQLKVKKENAPQ